MTSRATLASRAFADADNKIGTTVLSDDDPRSLEELVKDYYGGLVAADENIGRLFGSLEESGQLDNTIVVHSSAFFLASGACTTSVSCTNRLFACRY